MFYNFNDFNNQQKDVQAPNGKRPVTSGATNQGGMRTQNNFYKRKNLIEEKN